MNTNTEKNEKFITYITLAFQISLGLLFLNSGIGKVTKPAWFSNSLHDMHVPASSFFGIIISWGELLGGIALLVGVLVRLAAFLLSLIILGSLFFDVFPTLQDSSKNLWDWIGQFTFTPNLYIILGLGLISASTNLIHSDTLNKILTKFK